MFASAGVGKTVSTVCPISSSSSATFATLSTGFTGVSCLATGTGGLRNNVHSNKPDPVLTYVNTNIGSGFQVIGSTGGNSNVLSLTGTNSKSGTWSYVLPAAPKGYSWTNLVLAFEAKTSGRGPNVVRPDWAAFLLPTTATSGSWSFGYSDQRLSTANLYARLVATPTTVPVPAAGVLLAAAVGGMGLLRRRRKSA